ncbi:protein trichome birefringence-like 14 isoform X2 [Andrographis paniculata]|uniref:protein trichome birefringence-like 14 isoform X2 n=1 Tax=Andrographis paniculata TaxID=175694 RepID=UPI0021E8EC85|nr:protein trichome birefringence-like 14 isoform X2 [Andrographis paniculata]
MTKGGQSIRFWGRQSSFTIAVIFITTIFLWSWENNPHLVNLLSKEEPFIMNTPDLFADDSVESSLLLNPKEELKDEYSITKLEEGKTVEEGVQHFDNSNSYSVEQKDENTVLSSSLRNEDLFADDPAESSTLLNSSEQRKEKDSVSQPAKVKKVDTSTIHSESADIHSDGIKDERRGSTLSLQKIACNYGKGRWVADSRRPLYSGFGCKQWLSDMWACRLTKRSDFSYEKYRWQPSDCDMPEFEGAEFLRKMQDKTLAFIGDSLGRQQFQSLMCMISGGKDMPEVEDIGEKYSLAKQQGAIRPDGWAYWFPKTNTTVLYYWSASLCDIEPINATNPATEYAMHLDRPPSFLRQFLPGFNVVILNTGHHWNRGKLNANRWVMYANGKRVVDRKLAMMGNAKNHTLYSVARWLDSQISLRPSLKVFLRTISPRHFSHGEWNTGGSCDNVTPLQKGSEVFHDRSSDPVVEDALRGTKVKILDITALSELRDEGHISRYSIKASDGINDCLHWCLPGIPDTWNELVYAQL